MDKRLIAGAAVVGAGAVALVGAQMASAASIPAGPPSGSKTLQTKTLAGGVQYARYSNNGMSPSQVVSFYQNALRGKGWQTVNEGGGGSGWSDAWGGGGGGLSAIKTGNYFSVNAGGGGGPTYFEVCVGPNSQIVNNCQNVSQNAASRSNGS